MIGEVVIGISKHHVESNSAIEFAKVLFDIYASLKDEIYNVQITIASTIASAIIKTKQLSG